MFTLSKHSLPPYAAVLVGQEFQCGRIVETYIEFVAFLSVGKSIIFSNLAGIHPEVAACEFTAPVTLSASSDTRHQF